MKMKRTAVIAALSVIVGLGIVGISPAFAGTFCTTYGNQTSCYGSQGNSYTTTYGNQSSTYGTYNNGQSYTRYCTTYGKQTTCY